MKKKYQAPRIHVVTIAPQTILANSIQTRNLDGFEGYGGIGEDDGEID